MQRAEAPPQGNHRTSRGEVVRLQIRYSGEDSKHSRVNALIARKGVAKSVITCTPVYGRIISICISANITASTSSRRLDRKDCTIYQNWSVTVGRFGIGETKDGELGLLEFAPPTQPGQHAEPTHT
ncbi:hypothetical protein DPMN_109445 [Dreissena polymorpha]|uniref:Uncharacterized protein n=1 Tax=Dreissena polymorpha TaxID=45954 RepID=A0A9D4KAK9_DREPO|nr:hypothetical protein DPMN_109445 [Dreissena polymorpha]